MSAEPVTAESVEPAAGIRVRRARTGDVPRIQQLVEPLVMEGILLGKDLVVLYENVQEFRVAVDASGEVVGCGALHVMWEDLGEIRTLAAAPHTRGTGVGHALLERLEDDARELGLSRLFCLTFEVGFFQRHGYHEVAESIIAQEIYYEMLRSHDEGIAEFLDLSRVKPNTLGNTRMLKAL
ncbi:amino-acid N-acetyltransferase [Clavibacter zhangzhiyongii]|uniref:Amino-acid N-acetyltransferase n=1 Tax=Clavibacter zhangzhiyongii TaxID=2768071 RepID=A0A7L7Z1T4_9MICO|nr:amino-acid N-acetyltransferase [Clavibacter zhangzhiyongii]MBM7024433.1 amino-acid N-acetyltransferase [Clavibacter zhangzhiyongii]QOD43619.1 amino-acid N-acetyltransferase [Clavibacter zhangzhiyongii]